MKTSLLLLASGLSGLAGVLAAKPIHSLTISPGDVSVQLRLLLGDLKLQIDQTGNASHAETITATHTVCVSQTPAEVAACHANCAREFAGDPAMFKMCQEGCTGNQDCSVVCDAHATPDFVTFGSVSKLLLTKNCSAPTDACPSCTVGSQTPVFGDVDLQGLVPQPIFTKDIVIGTISCDLTRFGLDLSLTDNPGIDESLSSNITAQGLHISVKAVVDNPTITCSGVISIDATLQNPVFDFYLLPNVLTHRISWAATGAFSAHVSYALDSVYDLDSDVDGKVSGMIAQYISQNQLTINKGMTAWLLEQVQTRNNEAVDDLTGIVATTAGLTVSYTPLCVGGACQCTQSCNGAHVCEADYWNSTARACPAGQTCLASGDCCTPSCPADSCGSDGCGGSCGICSDNQMCQGGRCVACTDDCAHICSKSKCGYWCGTCKAGMVCDTGGCRNPGNLGRRTL